MAAKRRITSKPVLKTSKVHEFATGSRSGQVPEGDRRLTVNVRADLHRKLKHVAVDKGLTLGEMVERWIDSL